jgi:hypothetical protein
MKRIFIALFLAVSVYGFFNFIYPYFGTFSYKLTLVVETPEGRVVGSAVRKIYVESFNILPLLPEESGYQLTLKGEAVVIDLGKRGVLFSLLNAKGDDDYAENIVYQEFPYVGAVTPEGIKYYSQLKAKKSLSFDKLPMLVYFRDINDPKTVEEVAPNGLEKTFGKGVRLISATIEMTDDDVTKNGIEKRLPWISEYHDKLFDGNRYKTIDATNRLANSIGAGDFSAGMGLSKHE